MQKSEKIMPQTLTKYNILHADIHDLFDDIVVFATQCCDKPFAIVSFIDADKQRVISQVGSFDSEIETATFFCAHTINQTDILEIFDTVLDDRTQQTEWVLEAPYIRYYAGIPLINSEQQILGTLCVLDIKPNSLNQHQKSMLKRLAKNVLSQLELRRKNHELSTLKNLYQMIIENNPAQICVKDSDFKILHANSAFLSLYPEEISAKVTGYNTFEKYDAAQTADFLVQDKLAFEQGKTQTMEKRVLPSGEIRTLFSTKTRFEDDQGKSYILGVATDVTEREALIEKLQKTNSDLDEFAYITSHDLSAPISAIKRLVSWIEEDDGEVLQGDSLEHFAMIKNRIDRMNMLLKDLLAYSRVGKNDGPAQTLNLSETAKDCYVLLGAPKGLVMDVDDADLFLPKVPFELVLSHLISNAIKHHDKQSGHIQVNYQHLKHAYQISVTDDGPGIDPAFHEKIFKKFQTLKPRDELECSGLGLAVVEKALANHLGKISIKSELGKGSTFIVNWPKPGTTSQ